MTLLLRFRDLATAPGQTIRLHKKEISDHGHVWWGWWAKNGEQVPQSLFKELSGKAVEIYLFDTGALKLFKAALREIAFKETGEVIPSPQVEATPNYYKDQDYLAWFKLVEIEEIAVAKIERFSTVEVPEFFRGESSFKAFDQKRITGLGDLKLLERSIYFIRPAEAADKTLEEALANPLKQPANPFIQDFKATPQDCILWISDLHFTAHSFPITEVPGKKQLAEALYTACRDLKLAPAGIIASGDFTSKCDASGFEQADVFLKKLTSVLGLHVRDVLIIPGNHDVDYTPATGGKAIGYAPETAMESYKQFFTKFYGVAPNEHCSVGRRFVVANTHSVEIVGFNSVRLEQAKGEFTGFGFVGHKQWEHAESQYDWNKPGTGANQPIRLVVLHHHLLPINLVETVKANPNYSLTIDAEQITRWALERRVTAVLHGHMHEPWIARIQRPTHIAADPGNVSGFPAITICALGSTGVEKNQLGHTGQNTFGIISFENNDVRIRIYNVSSDGKSTLLMDRSCPAITAHK